MQKECKPGCHDMDCQHIQIISLIQFGDDEIILRLYPMSGDQQRKIMIPTAQAHQEHVDRFL